MARRPVDRHFPLLADTRGNVAVIFAIALVPLMLAAGAAVEYSRGQTFKSSLQGIVDAAALAGASAYYDATQSTAAATAATNSMNAGIAQLPAHVGTVTFSLTPGGSASTGYTMAVVAHATMQTPLMALMENSVGIGATATAINPPVSITPSGGKGGGGVFSSSAADKNSIYWYIVPTDGSLPVLSSSNLLYSNAPGFDNTKAQISGVSASQHIGFALVNVTGGLYGYGSNGYKAKQGSSHTFYSSIFPPSKYANSTSKETYSKVTNDCSIQALTVSDDSEPTAESGSCIGASSKYMAPSCTDIGTKTVWFYWNDMGGGSDDRDFNDAVFNFSCVYTGSGSGSGMVGGSSTASVHLTQ